MCSSSWVGVRRAGRHRSKRGHVSEHDGAAKLCELYAGSLAGFLVARGTGPWLIDDILQVTFLVLSRIGDEVLLLPNPRAYVFKIARGVAADRRRADEARSGNEQAWH